MTVFIGFLVAFAKLCLCNFVASLICAEVALIVFDYVKYMAQYVVAVQLLLIYCVQKGLCEDMVKLKGNTKRRAQGKSKIFIISDNKGNTKGG